MATSANFSSTPRLAATTIATANTNRDGTGTIGTVLTSGSNGSRIDKVIIHAKATTTAGCVRLFVYDGTTYYLFKEVPIVAITPSATNPAASMAISQETDLAFPLVLPSGYSLRASTEKAESFNIIAIGGDF